MTRYNIIPINCASSKTLDIPKILRKWSYNAVTSKMFVIFVGLRKRSRHTHVLFRNAISCSFSHEKYDNVKTLKLNGNYRINWFTYCHTVAFCGRTAEQIYVVFSQHEGNFFTLFHISVMWFLLLAITYRKPQTLPSQVLTQSNRVGPYLVTSFFKQWIINKFFRLHDVTLQILLVLTFFF